MQSTYRIAVVQMETGRDPAENLAKAFSLMEKAARSGPDFIVLPEMFEIVPDPSAAPVYGRPVPCDLTERLGREALRHSVNVVAGTILEREGEALYNTALVFDRRGELRGRYRKMHLFDAFSYGESSALTGGGSPLILALDGLTFGIAICYDVRFPELFRFYALGGAQAVFVPSAFFHPNHDHWELSLRARALDNVLYVVGCCQTGKRFVGRSMVVNPWGIAVASMGIDEGFFTVEIHTETVEKARKALPVLENRRFDVHLRP